MYKKQDKFIKINGFSIRYRESGNGDPLLLVHGISGFLEEWEPSIEKLSKHYRVIALDLPGHGLSDKPDIHYTLNCMTDFLNGFIIAKKLDKINLAGHSLGGAICLNYVIKYPSVVKKLITINSVFTKIPFVFRNLSFSFLQKLKFKIPLFFVKASSRRSFHNKKAITDNWLNNAHRYINTPGALRTMLSIVHECISLSGLKKQLLTSFLRGLSKIQIPVLVIYGTKDKMLPNENSLLLHKHIKNSKILAIKNCGHELPYECAEKFCGAVIHFL